MLRPNHRSGKYVFLRWDGECELGSAGKETGIATLNNHGCLLMGVASVASVYCIWGWALAHISLCTCKALASIHQKDNQWFNLYRCCRLCKVLHHKGSNEKNMKSFLKCAFHCHFTNCCIEGKINLNKQCLIISILSFTLFFFSTLSYHLWLGPENMCMKYAWFMEKLNLNGTRQCSSNGCITCLI